MNRNRRLLVGILLALGLIATRADAAPVAYSFSGTASGSIAGTDFINGAFQLGLLTDTDTVFQPFPGDPSIIRTANATLVFTINGVAGRFDTPFAVFRNASGPNPVVGLAAADGNDLLSIADPSFATYDLSAPFGPVTQSPPQFLNAGFVYQTDVGDVVFEVEPPASVTFQAVPSPIPVPGGFGLMASALGGLFLLFRRRTSVG